MGELMCELLGQFPAAFVGLPGGLLVDAYGATPLHALMVCNTDASLSLATKLIERSPLLLLNVHAGLVGYPSHFKGYEPLPEKPESSHLMTFAGENSLHLAAVNQREDWILQAPP